VVILAVAGAGYLVYRHFAAAGAAAAAKAQGAGGMALPVEGIAARQGEISTRLQVAGQLQAQDGVVLKSEVTGRVVEIAVKDGTPVKKGALLVRIDDSVQKADLAKALADLEVSEANVGRYQRLQQIGAASTLQVDNARAQAKLARANVQGAKAALDKMHITAPFDGAAGIVQVTSGEMIQPGQAIVAVTDARKMKVIFSLPERDALAMKPGVDVDVIPNDDVNTTPISGTIAALDGRVDPATRTVAAKVLVDNADGALVAGQFVRVSVPTHTVADAVIVPDSALVPNGSDIFVYVVNPAAKGMTMSSRTTVTVGLRTDNEAQITSGVQAGQIVVTAGQQKLMAPVMPVMVLSPTNITRSEATVEPLSNKSE
jgi:membrane fusion protein (multidrug efflux system)